MVLSTLLEIKGYTLFFMLLLALNCLSQALILLGNELVANLKIVKDLEYSISLFLTPFFHRTSDKLSYVSLVT
jgi:hypothetical protein